MKSAVAKGLPPTFQISNEVRAVATAFVELQENRHLADYDLTERFSRSDVMALIECPPPKQIDRMHCCSGPRPLMAAV